MIISDDDVRGNMSSHQLAFDRMTANQTRGALNHLIQDQAELFSDCERATLRQAQVILKNFVERTLRDVDGTI